MVAGCFHEMQNNADDFTASSMTSRPLHHLVYLACPTGRRHTRLTSSLSHRKSTTSTSSTRYRCVSPATTSKKTYGHPNRYTQIQHSSGLLLRPTLVSPDLSIHSMTPAPQQMSSPPTHILCDRRPVGRATIVRPQSRHLGKRAFRRAPRRV